MPITENTFTAEEFGAALTANPDLVNLVGTFVTHEQNKEHPLRKIIEPAIVSPVTSKHAKDIEAQVEKLTGIPKKETNQKYYEYLDYAVSEKLRTLSEAQQSMTVELEELRKKGNPSEQDRARIKQLEEGLAAKENEYTQKLTAKEQEIFNLKAGGQIAAELAGLRAGYKKDLPESLVKLAEENAVRKLMEKASLNEKGEVVFLDGAKAPLIDPNTLKVLDAKALLNIELKDLLDTGRQQQGAGSQEQNPGGGSPGGTGKFVGVPANVKTKVQLTDYLYSLGYTDSNEIDKVLAEHGKDLPLR